MSQGSSGAGMSLGCPSPESRSSAVISLLSPSRTLKIPYSEQKRKLAGVLLDHEHFSSTGELLMTFEKGVMFPVVHLLELPGPFVARKEHLLGNDFLGADFVLHQGIYEEIRQHLPGQSSRYHTPSQTNTAYIVAGFKVLDCTFRDVLENNWKDWTGARALYINLTDEFGLHRFSLYRRSFPRTDFATFSYVLLVECRTVTQENTVKLLDFVQRFRSHRMIGYLSVYGARHLGIESYASTSLNLSLNGNVRSNWWKEVQDAVASGSTGSTSDLSCSSESATSEEHPSRGTATNAPSVDSQSRSQLTPVEVISATSPPRVPNGCGAYPRRWNGSGVTGAIMAPIYENHVGNGDVEHHSNTLSTGTSNGSTYGLGDTDLSYSIEDSSVVSSVGSGSDPEPSLFSKTGVRRVWFEDCDLEDVIRQASERCDGQGKPPNSPVVDASETRRRSLAKEYKELDEMLRNLQCTTVPEKQPVRRKLW